MSSLKDVAREAGVSIKTVSNVLNKRNKEIRPSAQKRAEEIRKIAVKLNYQPNQSARAMRLQKTFQIGILMNSILNPISAQVADTLTCMLAAEGYQVLLSLSKDDSDRMKSYLRGFSKGIVDGVINLDPGVDTRIMEECLKTLPGVIWNRESALAASVQDYAGDTRAAVEHLCNLGHRHIGLISTMHEGYSGRLRVNFFREYLLGRSLPAEPGQIKLLPNWDFVDVGTQVRELLDVGCTAIVGGNDVFAAAVVHALHAMHINIPDEVSVIGFDDSLVAKLSSPQLTTMRRPIEKLCRGAIVALLRKINNEPELAFELVPSELVLRGTTARVSPR